MPAGADSPRRGFAADGTGELLCAGAGRLGDEREPVTAGRRLAWPPAGSDQVKDVLALSTGCQETPLSGQKMVARC